MRSRYMMLGALRLPLLLLTVLRPGVKDRASAGAPPDNSACLLWSSSNTTSPWKPGSSQETSMSVCRVVSLMTSPPGVEVGKVEGDACYFTARGPATAVGAGATCANGTTRRSTPPCDQWEIAAVNPRCRKTAAWASYTGAPGVFSADAVVAGLRAGLPAAKGQCGDTGALLGVCLAPPSAIEAGAPGKVFLTGPRKGQCCWNAGFKEHCVAGQVQQARPTPARAAAPHPPSSICVRLGDWSRAHLPPPLPLLACGAQLARYHLCPPLPLLACGAQLFEPRGLRTAPHACNALMHAPPASVIHAGVSALVPPISPSFPPAPLGPGGP